MKNIHPLDRAHIVLTSEKLKPASTFRGHEGIDKIVEKLGLYCIVTKTQNDFVCDATYDHTIHEELKEMRKSVHQKMDPKEWVLKCDHEYFGKIYGYPKCCTNAYVIDMSNGTGAGRRFKKQLLELKEVPQEMYSLIHIPCSPKCKESLILAKWYRTVLEKSDPEALQALEIFNQKKSK